MRTDVRRDRGQGAMPFIRVVLWVAAALAVVIVGFSVYRPPPADPPPRASAPPPAPRLMPAPAGPAGPAGVMNPGDMSSPAETTAEQAAEALRRLEGRP